MLGLEELHLAENQVEGINNLPSCLQMVDLSRNNITTLSNLPDTLEDLYLTGNKISDYESVLQAIHPLKDALKVIYLDMNPLDGSVYI